MNNYETTIFVSYAWGGESERIVEELEEAFTKQGVRIVRDKKDLAYKGSIDEFEKRIGKGQCIIVVIDDKYLRSEHCMYELVEANRNQNLRDRIFPIVLSNARIYKATDRLTYIRYWDKEIAKLNQAIKKVSVMANLSSLTNALDKYVGIRASFDHITDLLSDINALTPEIHTANGFSSLITAVQHRLESTATAENIAMGKRRIIGLVPKSPGKFFKDRKNEVALVFDALATQSNNLVFILGRGGHGKTAILSYILEKLESQNFLFSYDEKKIAFDTIIYLGKKDISFDKLVSLTLKAYPEKIDIINQFAQTDMPLSEKAKSLLDELRTEKLLICLDNFEEILDQNGQIVENGIGSLINTLLTVNCDLSILITSREMPILADVFPPPVTIKVNGLPSDDAISLMYALDIHNTLDMNDLIRTDLKVIVQKTNGIPQALYRVMSILSNEHTNIELSHLLENQSLFTGEVTDNIIAEAYRKFDVLTLLCLCALAVINYPVKLDVIHFLLTKYGLLSNKEIGKIFQQLSRMQLVKFDKQYKTYDLHPLDREYLLGNLGNLKNLSIDRADLEFQAVTYYKSIEKPQNEWIGIEDIRPNIKQIEHLLLAERDVDAFNILEVLDIQYLQRWGYTDYTIQFREKLEKGKISETEQIHNLTLLGDCYRRRGKLNLSLGKYEAALALAKKIGSDKDIAISYHCIAKIYVHFREIPKAFEYFDKSLAIASRIGNQTIISICLGSIASLNHSLGYINLSIEGFKNALEISEKIRDQTLQQMWLSDLGQAFADIGQGQLALEYNYKALSISENLDVRNGKAARLWSIGKAYVVLNDFNQAIHFFQESIKIAIAIKHYPIQDQSLIDLCGVWVCVGNIQAAEHHLRLIVEQVRETHPFVKLQAITSLATVLAFNQNKLHYQESLSLWQRSIILSTDLIQNAPLAHGPYYIRAVSYIALGDKKGLQDIIHGLDRFRHYLFLKNMQVELELLRQLNCELANDALNLIVPITPLKYHP